MEFSTWGGHGLIWFRSGQWVGGGSKVVSWWWWNNRRWPRQDMKEIVEYMARLGNFKGFGAKFVMLTSMDGQNLVNVRGGGGGAAVDGGGDGGADGGEVRLSKA